MGPPDRRVRRSGVAGEVNFARGLETHRFPRAVPIKRYDLKRLSLKGELSPGSGEGQGSKRIEARTSYVEDGNRAGVQSTHGLPGPMADDLCTRSRRNAVRDGIGS